MSSIFNDLKERKMTDQEIEIVEELEKHTEVKTMADGGVVEFIDRAKFYDLAQKLVKIITYEPVLATGLTNEQILDEAARRKANIALQYEDYSLETWTVATKLLPHRKAYLLDDDSIRKFRIEYEM